jgi:hypothetical protein
VDVATRYVVAIVCVVIGAVGFIDRIPLPFISMSLRRQIGGAAVFAAVIMFLWALGGPDAV